MNGLTAILTITVRIYSAVVDAVGYRLIMHRHIGLSAANNASASEAGRWGNTTFRRLTLSSETGICIRM